MDSRLLTIIDGEHRTVWSAAARLPRYRSESAVLDLGTELSRGNLPTAALDWATQPA